jgi:hypothetical protein
MATNTLHPSYGGRGAALAEPPPGQGVEPTAFVIDWRAARRASRACCCPAKPAVVAVMPPSPGRPHPTDLLLCGHHHRVSRRALEAAGALVLDMDGVPAVAQAWPQARARAGR